MPETPSIPQWLCRVLKKRERVGIDGYTTSLQTVNELRNELSAYGIEAVMIEDPYKTIWNDRPGLPDNKPFILEEIYSGESASSKISTIRNHISNTGTDYILISALDEIAWTLNMRGTDIECNPLFVS